MLKTIFIASVLCFNLFGNEKTKDSIALMRESMFQTEQLDGMISVFVQQAINLAKSDMDAGKAVAIAKERILSDEFLSKYTGPLDRSFAHDEIKTLIGYYKSDEMKKFHKSFAEIGMPVYGGIQEVIDGIVNGPKEKTPDKVTLLTNQNYQSEMQEWKGVAILEVYSTLCPPCKILAPTFSELSNDLGDQVKFMKLNSDTEFNISRELGIHSVPTLLFIKDGKVIDRHVGLINKADLDAKIKEKLF